MGVAGEVGGRCKWFEGRGAGGQRRRCAHDTSGDEDARGWKRGAGGAGLAGEVGGRCKWFEGEAGGRRRGRACDMFVNDAGGWKRGAGGMGAAGEVGGQCKWFGAGGGRAAEPHL